MGVTYRVTDLQTADPTDRFPNYTRTCDCANELKIPG